MAEVFKKGKFAEVMEHMKRNSSRMSLARGVKDSIANFGPSLQDKLSQQKIILREELDTMEKPR